MIEIIIGSISQLIHAIEIFLQSKDLTLGAILAGVSPFIVLWIKISNEKGKKAKQLLIERRQMQIAYNVNEILEALKVESKWSLQEIGSTNTVQPKQKKLHLFLQMVTIQRRKAIMEKLKSRKFWLTILAALIPVINSEFGINLDLGHLIAIMSTIMAGVGFIAHVDAKKILASIMHTKITVANAEMAFTTFQEAIPYLKGIHADINQLLEDVKKDNTTEAFKDAMRAYMQIKAILDNIKHPDPVQAIPDAPEQKVVA